MSSPKPHRPTNRPSSLGTISTSDLQIVYNENSTTALPTPSPSIRPSFSPTTLPWVEETFIQTYKGETLGKMTDDQIIQFQDKMEGYIGYYGPHLIEGDIGSVTADCIFVDQVLSEGRRLGDVVDETPVGEGRFENGVSARRLKEFYLEVEFRMKFSSLRANFTRENYPLYFKVFMDSEEGKDMARFDLRSIGLSVEEIDDIRIEIFRTEPPSSSPTIETIPVPTPAPVSHKEQIADISKVLSPSPTGVLPQPESSTKSTFNYELTLIISLFSVVGITLLWTLFRPRNRDPRHMSSPIADNDLALETDII